jgi:hypothetical protein
MTFYIYYIWSPNENKKYGEKNTYSYLCSQTKKNINNKIFNTLKSMNCYFFNDKNKYKQLHKMFDFEIYNSAHDINYIMNNSDYNIERIYENNFTKQQNKLISNTEDEILFVENINNQNTHHNFNHNFYKKSYNNIGSLYYYPKCIIEYLINGKKKTTISFEKKKKNTKYGILWENLQKFPHSFLIKKMLIDLDLFHSYYLIKTEEQIAIDKLIDRIKNIKNKEDMNEKENNTFNSFYLF